MSGSDLRICRHITIQGKLTGDDCEFGCEGMQILQMSCRQCRRMLELAIHTAKGSDEETKDLQVGLAMVSRLAGSTTGKNFLSYLGRGDSEVPARRTQKAAPAKHRRVVSRLHKRKRAKADEGSGA